MCQGLFERSPRFRDFAANVGVVPTRSVQMWCDKATFEMGWKTGKAATVSGPEYLNIWADMTQVMAFESWSAPPPRSLHYLTGTYNTTLFKQPATDTTVPTGRWRRSASRRSIGSTPRPTGCGPADRNGAFTWDVLRATPG